MYCADCGHLNRSEAKFCERCGHALPHPSATDDPPPRSEAIGCLVCGFQNRPVVRFCERCGYDLHAPPTGQRQGVRKRRSIARVFGAVVGIFVVVVIGLVGTLFFRYSRASASSLPRRVTTNDEPPIPPSELSGGDGLFEFESINVLYETPEHGPFFTYQEGGFGYTYWNSTWIAMRSEPPGLRRTLDRLITNAFQIIYVFGTHEGTITRDGDRLVYQSAGPPSPWINELFESMPEMVDLGGEWVLDLSGSPLDWAENQEIQGGMLVRNGSDVEVINTSAFSELERTQLGFKFLLGLGSFNPKAAIAIAINPVLGTNYIVTSILEKAVSGDWSEGCGNREWAWALPDGDLSAIASAGLFEIWEDACLAHDECYGVCEKDQRQCDVEFKDDMTKACGDLYDPLGNYIPYDLDILLTGGGTASLKALYAQCVFLAGRYYSVVRDVGRNSYSMKPHLDTFEAVFEADNPYLTYPECTNLNFEVTNAPEGGITMSGQGINAFSSRVPSGTFQVCPEQTTIFTMKAQDCGGNWHEFNATVHVQRELEIELLADAYSLTLGECTTLRWSVTGFYDQIWIDGGYQPPTGSKRVCPQQSTQYGIEFEMGDGSRKGEILVIRVSEPEEPSQEGAGILDISYPGCSPGWSPCGEAACPIGFCNEISGSYYCQWEPSGEDDPLWGGGCEPTGESGVEVVPPGPVACTEDISGASTLIGSSADGGFRMVFILGSDQSYQTDDYRLWINDKERMACSIRESNPQRLACIGDWPALERWLDMDLKQGVTDCIVWEGQKYLCPSGETYRAPTTWWDGGCCTTSCWCKLSGDTEPGCWNSCPGCPP